MVVGLGRCHSDCLGAKSGYTGWKGLSQVGRYLMSTVCPALVLGTLPLLTPPQPLRARPRLPPDSSGASTHLPLLEGDHAVGLGFMVGVRPAQIPVPASLIHPFLGSDVCEAYSL